jgi:hypothetical protein
MMMNLLPPQEFESKVKEIHYLFHRYGPEQVGSATFEAAHADDLRARRLFIEKCHEGYQNGQFLLYEVMHSIQEDEEGDERAACVREERQKQTIEKRV